MNRSCASFVALLLGAGLAGCAGGAPATAATPAGGTAAISPERLKGWLYAYAADSMEGREAGTPGNVKATAWIAAEAQRIGLTPAGENGGWFQVLPLTQSQIQPGSAIEAAGRRIDTEKEMVLFGAFPMFGFSGTLEGTGIPTVFGGRIGDKSSGLTADQVAGKLIVFEPPLNPAGKPMWQFWNQLDRGVLGASRGALIVANDVMPQQVMEYLRAPQATLVDEGAPPTPPNAPFVASIGAATARTVLGADPASLKAGAAGQPVNANVRMIVGPAKAPARNVIAVLPGSDPTLKAQYVAVGSHNDHVGFSPVVDHDSVWAYNNVIRPTGAEGQPRAPTMAEAARIQALRDSLGRIRPSRPDSINNGADDDGSGTVAVLAVAEALAKAKVKPKRSILFVWHTGEEKGLWGSAYFTDHPTVPRDAIVAQLNMDMVGRGKASDSTGAGPGGPNQLQLIGSRRLSTELGDLVEKVNTTGGHGFTFDYALDANGHPSNIYCRSDHYMYARYGIPVTFFTTGVHQDYHMVTDEAEYIDYQKLTKVSRLIADITTQVANLDHAPVVDKP
ncbi:MAG TPA: M20/M25/M40 family metallo-hydrolase, partial [Gemmatimonadales bacterium]|nr:M20/M25/M40 family metallo-hydrolase [Gemmatimonadales bacterium]